MAIRFWFKVNGNCPGCGHPLPFKKVLFSGDPIPTKWVVQRNVLHTILTYIADHPDDWMECSRCYSIGYQAVWLGADDGIIEAPYCPSCIPHVVRKTFGATIPSGFFGVAVPRSARIWRTLATMGERYKTTGDIHEANANGHGSALIF